ncbi:MAG: hypothetical protein ABIJ56_23790 [Pseudomonadota bacterium]
MPVTFILPMNPMCEKTVFIVLLFATVAACDASDGNVTVGAAAFPQTSEATARAFQAGPVRLNPPGSFMTSPHWLPDGSGVIASGHSGIGLFMLKPGDPGSVTIHETYAGGVDWTDDGNTLCLAGPGSLGAFDYDAAAGTLVVSLRSAAMCELRAEAKYLEKVVFERSNVRILHDGLYGGLRVEDGAAETTVEDAGAWSVAISPDGSKIAYCTGSLAEPSLFVYDRAGGKTSVGSGAHPSWFPESRFLVYALPETKQNALGRNAIARSELIILDTLSSTSENLTDTQEAAEMQPAVSPDGNAVVFSDWRTGAITVLPVGKDRKP